LPITASNREIHVRGEPLIRCFRPDDRRDASCVHLAPVGSDRKPEPVRPHIWYLWAAGSAIAPSIRPASSGAQPRYRTPAPRSAWLRQPIADDIHSITRRCRADAPFLNGSIQHPALRPSHDGCVPQPTGLATLVPPRRGEVLRILCRTFRERHSVSQRAMIPNIARGESSALAQRPCRCSATAGFPRHLLRQSAPFGPQAVLLRRENAGMPLERWIGGGAGADPTDCSPFRGPRAGDR